MSFNDEKPKYGYEDKPNQMQPERGGCLTAFLILGFIGNLLAIPLILFAQSAIADSPYASDAGLALSPIFLFLIFILSVAGIACIWGLWNWKRWGYNGTIALYVIGAVVNFVSAGFSSIVSSFIGLGILVYLMKDKTQYLE